MRRKRSYSSFLIRSWAFSTGEHRINIEHIQSRARVQVSSLAAALEWIGDEIGPRSADKESTTDALEIHCQASKSPDGQGEDEIATMISRKGLEQ